MTEENAAQGVAGDKSFDVDFFAAYKKYLAQGPCLRGELGHWLLVFLIQ